MASTNKDKLKELLGKIAISTNTITVEDDINHYTILELINALRSNVKEINKNLDNLDGEIKEEVKRLIDDGTLGKLINDELLGEINAQLSEITFFSPLKTGAHLQREILEICKSKSANKKIILTNDIQCDESIYIPTGFELDLNGHTIKGNLEKSLFKSGVFTGNEIIPYPSDSLVNSLEMVRIHNGSITNSGLALDFKKLNRGCKLENLFITNCKQAIKLERCYYTILHNIVYRNKNFEKEDYESPCIQLYVENNSIKIDSLRISNRKLGLSVEFTTSAININNTTFEGCGIGYQELGSDIRNTFITNSYFENCEYGAKVSTQSKLDNNFFNGCTVAIRHSDGAYIYENNVFRNCVKKIEVAQQGGGIVINKQTKHFGDTNPTLDNVDGPLDVNTHFTTIVNGGNPNRSLINTGCNDNINPLPYTGRSGYISNAVPFCKIEKVDVDGTNYNCLIHTKISIEEFNFVGFRFKVTDNNAVHDLHGIIYGEVVECHNSTNKTIEIINNDGYLSLKLKTFSHPTLFMGCEGVIRIL